MSAAPPQGIIFPYSEPPLDPWRIPAQPAPLLGPAFISPTQPKSRTSPCKFQLHCGSPSWETPHCTTSGTWLCLQPWPHPSFFEHSAWYSNETISRKTWVKEPAPPDSGTDRWTGSKRESNALRLLFKVKCSRRDRDPLPRILDAPQLPHKQLALRILVSVWEFFVVRACVCVSLFIPYLEDLAFSTKQCPDEEPKVPSATVYVLLSVPLGFRE